MFGLPSRTIAEKLNALGIEAPRGGQWAHAMACRWATHIPHPRQSLACSVWQLLKLAALPMAAVSLGKHRSLRLRFPVVRCPEFIDQSRHGDIEPIYSRTRAFDFVVQGGELVQNAIELVRYRVQCCYIICHDVHTISPAVALPRARCSTAFFTSWPG
jgi:hypothetical protein